MASPGLGSLGDIGFISVMSRNRVKVRTFKDFTRVTADRWTASDIHLKKPRQQYLGPGLDAISFIIVLDVSLGMNPRKEMDKLVGYSRDGKALTLEIGGKKLGVNKWVIKGLSQTWTHVDPKGDVLRGEISIDLEEYA
ncbi:phage tail protein [Paenibacillus sp. UASWS1643]|uniref:phage tail protein n=1 Tax=Paenibacillus sp. UASWS1643 TaxID=2580422 RepID=UPI00123963E8|nr:phage tail protein [Paenibacillus sp. UASWS1643]KAA8750089.1 phage tail protein [Paenibacillus sp. UASWS1643]